ncbi:hypothetical protein BH23ACI1_BH23ACI1_06060 [soil metagenome]
MFSFEVGLGEGDDVLGERLVRAAAGRRPGNTGTGTRTVSAQAVSAKTAR